MLKYVILLGLSLGLVACGGPINNSSATSVDIIKDKENPCIVYIWNSTAFRTETFVAHIIGCDPNQNQRLP